MSAQTEALELVVEVLNGRRVTERHVDAAEALYLWILDLATDPAPEPEVSRKDPKIPTREEVRDAVLAQQGEFTEAAIRRAVDAPYANLERHFEWLEARGIVTTLERRGRGGATLYEYVPPASQQVNRERQAAKRSRSKPVAGTGRTKVASKGARQHMKAAREAGLEVKSGSKHVKIVNRSGQLVAIVGSPSDHRSNKNTEAAIKREGRNGS